MKTLPLLATIAILSSVLCAQEPPPVRPAASTPIPPIPDDTQRELREIRTVDIRNIEFGTSSADLRFSVGDTTYIFRSHLSTDSNADRIAITSSLLAELRRSNKITFYIRPAEAAAKQITFYSMAFHFDSLK
jgi:hypothetical protein